MWNAYAIEGVPCSKEEMADRCGVPADELDEWLEAHSAGPVEGQYGGAVSAIASAYQGEIQRHDGVIEDALRCLGKAQSATDGSCLSLVEEAIELLEGVDE